ncbi:hypothetical protein RRF57_007500 [Xylaria bambusicola]|uniref:Uncharacterized protein n=1 Tax=Xylaria bambusicola TaxID=326684 RepID=A0AAN7US29_9PEZI
MPGEHTGPSVSSQTSPKTPGESSPYQTSLRGGGDRQAENKVHESAGTSQSNGENKQQLLPLRAIGVHNILNPAETQPSLVRERGEETGQSPKISSAASSSSPRIPPYFAYQESGMARRGQTTPTIEDQPLTAPSSAERPYPPLAAARRVLTPRSPRLMSPGHSHPLRALGPPQVHPQHLPTGSQDSNRAILSDTTISKRSDQALSTRALL